MREIREKSGKVKKCLIVRVESEKFEKNEENQGKVREFKQVVRT